MTALLLKWRGGDREALDALLPLVYQELRRVARAHLRRERAGHTLQTTALVHEVYLRLVGVEGLSVQNRTHFMAIAARMMRQVLVDHARRQRAGRRGGGGTLQPLEVGSPSVSSNVVDVLAVDAALEELAQLEERLCRVTELRFFAGLTIDETALALDVSPATVERDWAVAKAWLYDRLFSGEP